MSITVLKAGVLDTVQDAGRIGFASQGVNPTGAMDKQAMQLANALAGNTLTEAVIELHFPAAQLLFNQAAIIALAGADFGAVILRSNNEILSFPANRTAFIQAGDKLLFQKKLQGERCYLAVQGGFQLTAWLNSFSTHIKLQQGGYSGRPLKKNDRLTFQKQVDYKLNSSRIFPWFTSLKNTNGDGIVQILKGPEWHWLTNESQQAFLQQPFTVSTQSDRMGISLQAEALQRSHQEELVSSGVVNGAIQLLPSGQLTILMADRGTTGGYPRIAVLTTVSVSALSQMSAGASFKFAFTTQTAAEDWLIQQHRDIIKLQAAIKLNLLAIG